MKFNKKEANTRLVAIKEMCQHAMHGQSMLTTTYHLLSDIIHITTGTEGKTVQAHPPPLDHVILSCDASIKENPGGDAALGAVIQLPGYKTKNLELSTRAQSTTCNQAEYEAIYWGLTTLMGLRNNPGCEVEVRSDSKLVVDQLNGEMKCNDKKLQAKRDTILELVRNLPLPVKFVWRPRNSTPELRRANNLAQDELGVPNH